MADVPRNASITLSSDTAKQKLSTISRHLVVVCVAAASTGAILYLASALGEWVNRELSAVGEISAPQWVYTSFYVLFCFYVIGILFPFFLFLGWRGLRPRLCEVGGRLPMVSVIIPAYNEEAAIERSIQGALGQDYPDFEVIIVDDGSRDMTPFFVEHSRVTAVHLQRNLGKAAAMNAAISRAKGEVLVFSDADSFLDKQAVRRLVGHFDDPAVGAVAGRIEISNPSSLLVSWQQLEYLLGQEIVKEAQLGSGSSVTVCPGPVSAFRRRLLLEIGGYKDRTLTEDFDITLETIEHGYRVAYDPRALARTHAPVTWSELYGQRLRWYRGNLQVFSIHRGMCFTATQGLIGFFWLPYSLLVGFGGVLLESFLLAAFPFLLWVSGAPVESLLQGLIFMILIELLGAGQYLVAVGLAGRWSLALVLAALVVKPFHLFLAWTRLLSIFHHSRKKEATWGKQ